MNCLLFSSLGVENEWWKLFFSERKITGGVEITPQNVTNNHEIILVTKLTPKGRQGEP